MFVTLCQSYLYNFILTKGTLYLWCCWFLCTSNVADSCSAYSEILHLVTLHPALSNEWRLKSIWAWLFCRHYMHTCAASGFWMSWVSQFSGCSKLSIDFPTLSLDREVALFSLELMICFHLQEILKTPWRSFLVEVIKLIVLGSVSFQICILHA